MKIDHVEEFAGKGIQGDALAGTISCGSRNFIESLELMCQTIRQTLLEQRFLLLIRAKVLASG